MNRRVRVLLAWFSRQDAIVAQFGFRVPNPGEDEATAAATYEAQCAARLSRVPFAGEPAVLGPLPEAIAAVGAARLGELVAQMTAADAARLRLGLVDLTRVLSLQKAVTLDEVESRVARAAPDAWTELAAICLPAGGADLDALQGTFDKDGKGVTIVSPNPNLRVTPVQNMILPGSGARVVGFQIVFGSPHMHVVEYRGRCILKDGYHRAYGLLARGVSRVPCIVERAGDFTDVHSGSTTLISPGDLLGEHPPRLTDYFDPAVSLQVEQRVFRKAIRIHAEEFAVNL